MTVAGIPVIMGGPEKNHEDRQAECAKRWTMGRTEIKMELSKMRKVRNGTSVQPTEQRHTKPSIRALTQ